MLGPGCFLSGLLCWNLMWRPMMYWNHHIKKLFIWARLRVAYCLCSGGAEGWAWTRLYFLWGIACFSSMDIAGCGRRNKQTFSVYLPHPPTPHTHTLTHTHTHTHFLQGWACSQRQFCDWCVSGLCVYLFVLQTNELLTRHCHMLSSRCILRLHQCLSIQV